MSFYYNGDRIKFEVYGESHSESIGIKCEGLPAGVTYNSDMLLSFMSRRAPGKKGTTPRKEPDIPIIVSGVTDGKTNGEIFEAIIRNTNIKSKDYGELDGKPRPGHADYPYFIKSGNTSLVGGGEFSARLTAPTCILGGILLQELLRRGIRICARISSVSNVNDTDEFTFDSLNEIKTKDFPTVSEECGREMQKLIESVSSKGDSIGGTVECFVDGLPIGLGGAGFCGIDGKIAYSVFGIPAVKGIEFGKGFEASKLFGSQNNDFYYYENGKVVTRTNNCGGILGGMSNGEILNFKVAFKPTPSISVVQDSVDLLNKKNTTVSVKGRHDPCVAVRAVPIVEAVTAIAVYDILINEENN